MNHLRIRVEPPGDFHPLALKSPGALRIIELIYFASRIPEDQFIAFLDNSSPESS